MFGKQNLGADLGGEESGYREFHLRADIKQSRLVLILFAIPIIGFVFNDYLFFGISGLFYEVISVRIALLIVIGLELLYLQKVKSYQAYDKVVFFSILAMIVGGGFVNATRPSNFIITSLISIVSVFVIYLGVPLKLGFQVFLASFLTIGESLIILVLSKNLATTFLFALLFSMLVANLLAAFSAWQTHSYRRRTYREFMQRKALQDKLEQHANHLSDLVKDRTKDL